MDTLNTKNAHQPPKGRWAFLFARQSARVAVAFWLFVATAAVLGAGAIIIVQATAVGPFDGVEGLAQMAVGHRLSVQVDRRALDGAVMAAGEEQPDYVAVMVENSIDARPLSGLSQAALVYEAPVEGGITRFFAVFPLASSGPAKIGPVRSARRYYVEWAEELGAAYAHVGGSPEALDILAKSSVRDLNEFFNGKYFWRDARRGAPHNAYTSAELLSDAAAQQFAGAKSATSLPSWQFKDDAPPAKRRDAKPLVVDFSTPAYRVSWIFDAKRNEYIRYQGSIRQADEDGNIVRAKNVVVLFTQVRSIDEVDRRFIATMGNGEAVISVDGNAMTGTWVRKTRSDRTTFFGEDGKETQFNAGPTWIEVVPEGTIVTF